MTLSLWAEQMDDDDVAIVLPTLARHELGLGLMLSSVRIGDERFARLTRAAAEHGVPVRAWPLLPLERGYWLGDTNAEAAAELLYAVGRWRARRGGPALAGVSVDLEPNFAYAERLRAASQDRPDRLFRQLLEQLRSRTSQASRRALAAAVDRLRREGLVAHAVTYPLVLDQPLGSTLLERALDIVVSGIDWDEISFMVYQTPFAQLVGEWLGPELIQSYAKSATERFGARAGIDLGIVGDAGVGVGPGRRYPNAASLWEDLRAAGAAGIPLGRTRVYGLAGMLASGGIEAWLPLGGAHRGDSSARAQTPAESRPPGSGGSAGAAERRRMVGGLRNAFGALEVALRVAET